ncbi:PucR family transcriptional regulator [Nocardioides alkalitolerans]|uniref:PucR family transcriptional regulator n=1 Tax=Nocardioides alkalitolerans TaxID=281714 RepID=UPI0003FB82D6|nr:PucR family transcriptional regulator [Nocardioides alkalitolerans]
MSTQVQKVIDALAEKLQRSVVIDDPQVRLLFASPHYGDEDPVRTQAMLQRDAGKAAIGYVLSQGVTTWTRAGVIPPNPELAMHARVCMPIRWRAELLGLLLVVDVDGTMTTTELALISEVGHELAALMVAEHEATLDPDLRDREAAVADLFHREPAVRRSAVRTLAAHIDMEAATHVRVLEVEVRGGAQSSPAHVVAALRRAIEIRDASVPGDLVVGVLRDRSASVLLGAHHPISSAVADRYAERLITEVRDVSAGRFDCVVGVGSEVDGLDRAWSAGRQAALACRAAGGLVDARVVNWEALGPHAILLRLPAAEMEPETLPDEMQRLLAVDRGGRLVTTLRAFLDHAGNMPATAEALHIHRTTLYYRLERITELAGLDLDDGSTRLVLHMSLRLMDAMPTLARRDRTPDLRH